MKLAGALLVCSIALSGCASQPVGAAQVIEQSDVTTISLPQSDQSSSLRVVALANGAAEIISSLGLQNLLVGRDIASTEAALEDIPVVTSGHQVLPEKVIALNANLVLVDATTGPANALDQIQSAGIRVVQIPESWRVQDIERKIKAIAVALNAESQAKALLEKINNSYKQSQITSDQAPRVAFLYLRGTNSIYFIGGPGSGTDSLLQRIGAVDVGAASLKNPFNALTAELLAAANPDVLLVMTKGLESVGGIDGLLALPGVAQTSAGKNSRVIAVDDSLLLSFGPRTPSLLEQLSKKLSNEEI
jgi:iron complex transport system substrate-binding protein